MTRTYNFSELSPEEAIELITLTGDNPELRDKLVRQVSDQIKERFKHSNTPKAGISVKPTTSPKSVIRRRKSRKTSATKAPPKQEASTSHAVPSLEGIKVPPQQ